MPDELEQGQGQELPEQEKETPEDKRARVTRKVREVIADQLSIMLDKIQLGHHFMKDLGADSLDQIELIMEFEDEFDLNIPDKDGEKIKTVGEAINYIVEHAPDV